MSLSLFILLVQALQVLLVVADPFNLTVVEAGTDGDTVSYRVWYGDGQAYVGPNTPDDVEQAVDITSPGTVDEILYIEAAAGTPANSVLSQSASPYFMVINAAPTASDPISFTDSLSSLPFTTTDAAVVHLWVAYNGYLLPVTDGGSLLQAPGGGGAYLVPVDGADGTYSLRWIMDADLAGALGGSKVLLSSLPVLAVASS